MILISLQLYGCQKSMNNTFFGKRKALEMLDFKGFMWLPEQGSIRACGLGRGSALTAAPLFA